MYKLLGRASSRDKDRPTSTSPVSDGATSPTPAQGAAASAKSPPRRCVSLWSDEYQLAPMIILCHRWPRICSRVGLLLSLTSVHGHTLPARSTLTCIQVASIAVARYNSHNKHPYCCSRVTSIGSKLGKGKKQKSKQQLPVAQPPPRDDGVKASSLSPDQVKLVGTIVEQTGCGTDHAERALVACEWDMEASAMLAAKLAEADAALELEQKELFDQEVDLYVSRGIHVCGCRPCVFGCICV